MSNSKEEVLLSLTGPTCSGKNEIFKELTKKYNFYLLIGDVTREPRPNEIPGVDYNFLSREEFKQRSKNGEYFAEVEFRGNLYGTRLSEIDHAIELGKTPGVIVEPSGLQEVNTVAHKAGLQHFSVYVSAPAEDCLKRYFKRTGQKSLEENPGYHLSRLRGLSYEIEKWPTSYKYSLTITNEDIMDTDVQAAAFSIAGKCGNIPGYEKIENRRSLFLNSLETGTGNHD